MFRVVVVAILLSICVAPAVAEPTTIMITLRDRQFLPSEVPVPAGVKVELIVHNAQTVTAEFESTSLHREKVVAPGARISVFVGPLNPGRYEFFDDFNQATRGVLVVR